MNGKQKLTQMEMEAIDRLKHDIDKPVTTHLYDTPLAFGVFLSIHAVAGRKPGFTNLIYKLNNTRIGPVAAELIMRAYYKEKH